LIYQVKEIVVNDLKLIACDPIVGLPRVPIEGYRPDRENLLSQMNRLRVSQAIVRHRTALECGPHVGNSIVLEETQGESSLLPTWMVAPDGLSPDFDPAKLIDDMIASSVRVCWIDPQAEGFSLLPWCSGPLYEILQARQIPMLLDYNRVKCDDLDLILSAFEKLTVILLSAPRCGRNRFLYPLLKRHTNLWLCLSHTYSVPDGIEDLCRTFGDQRWVFGMGYPDAEGGSAVAGLSYANVSDQTREAIAHRNIEILLERVR
jgi:hypothetical protein